MAYWQHPSPGGEGRLAELADLFAASRQVFFDIFDDQFHWTPATTSLASRDLSNAEVGPSGPWGERPVRHLFTVVSEYLVTTTGHLGGLAALHAGQEVLLAPPALVRSVIEGCARSIWILGFDGTEATRGRVARTFLEEMLSASEAKTVAGRLGDKTSERYTSAQSRYLDLRDKHIPALFADVTREELIGNGYLAGHKRPGPEEGVQWMYEGIERFGAGVTARQGLGVYGLLCNMTHPTLYPLREMTRWKEIDGRLQSYLYLDLDYLARQASAAVITYYNAITLAMSYFGWQSVHLDRWEALIDRVLPGSLT